MRATANLTTPKHGYIEVQGGYGTVGQLTRVEAESLIRDLRKACDAVERHNRSNVDITKDRP